VPWRCRPSGFKTHGIGWAMQGGRSS